MWQEGLDRAAERPAWGWGPGSADLLLDLAAEEEIRQYSHFHNAPLMFVLSLGVVGASLLAAVVGLIAWEALRGYRSGELPPDLALFALGGMMIFFLVSLFQYRLGEMSSQLLLVLIGSAALGTARYREFSMDAGRGELHQAESVTTA
jgi:O-antigen ligase